MRGLLIYDKEGYRRNEWFVDQLIKSADALGCELKLVIYDGAVDFDTSVDFAIVRTICPGINEYFETHDDISVREFARISNYAPSTSYAKLNDYVAHGEMERVPRVNGCFRPTKGNFGRE